MTQLMQERTETRARTWRDDWPLAVAAAVAASVEWVVATKLAGVDLAVGDQQINVVSVIVTAVVVTLAASGLLRFLESRTARGRSIWTAIAVVVAMLSLAGPLGANSLQAGLWLVSLHAVVGSVVLVGLRRSRTCA